MEGMLIGNWKTERLLGEGGMGRVYLARHKHLNTVAALKVLHGSLTHDESFRNRFLKEAQTQSQLKHSNIAGVIDYIEQDGQYYLVVEYLGGGTLADLIDKAAGPIDIPRALAWTKQALCALDYAHQLGVIHRDIKPSNIMFDDAGVLKVMDFGIALVMGGRRLTSTGVTMGTPEYMSPEQIVRPNEVDHRIDVYATGIVLYEMLTGRPPFQGDTDFSIRAAQVNEPPPPLRHLNPAIPEALEQVTMKAIAKDPNRRYSGCGEFVSALNRLTPSGGPDDGVPRGARTPTVVEPVGTGQASNPSNPVGYGAQSGHADETFNRGGVVQPPNPSTPAKGKTKWLIAILVLIVLAAGASAVGLYVRQQQIEEARRKQEEIAQQQREAQEEALRQKQEELRKAQELADLRANPFELVRSGAADEEPDGNKIPTLRSQFASPLDSVTVIAVLKNRLYLREDQRISYQIVINDAGGVDKELRNDRTISSSEDQVVLGGTLSNPDDGALDEGSYSYTVTINGTRIASGSFSIK
jgi:serine/threonine protein kinase/type II secretory pathway pseudopilin PulG